MSLLVNVPRGEQKLAVLRLLKKKNLINVTFISLGKSVKNKFLLTMTTY